MSLYRLVADNYVFVFVTLLTAMLLATNRSLEHGIRIRFTLLLVISCLSCILYNAGTWLYAVDALYPLHNLIIHVHYMLKAGLLFIVLMIAERDHPLRLRLFHAIPLLLYCIVMLISLPTRSVVYISEETGHFMTGPLFVVSWIILPVYILMIVLSAIFGSHTRSEAAGLLVSATFLILNIVIELVFGGIDGMQTSVIAISVLTVYLYFQSRSYQEDRARLKAELATARIQSMLSRIKPHFIYNALSCIAELCHENPARAEATVLTFSSYLRNGFRSLTDGGLIPFTDELNAIRTYVELEQLQSAGNLYMIYDVKVTDFRVPCLALETLVENAFKHGLRKKRDGGTVVLRTERSYGQVTISITDDGLGFDPKQLPASTDHLGLVNARLRLKEQCNATFSLESAPGAGTTIIITIPEE